MAFDIRGNAIDEELAYTVTTKFRSISGTAQHDYVLFRNKPSNTVRVKILALRFGNDASVQTIVRMFHQSDITSNGTALTESNRYFKNTPRVAQLKTYYDPTIGSRNTYINSFVGVPDGRTMSFDIEYLLDPGNRLLFTVQNSATNKKTHIDLDWVEIPI